MTTKTIINPRYQHLQDFISRLPEIFESEGEYLHDGRNKIKVFEAEGLRINVKRYRIPLFVNRFVYIYLRQPKAVRAYHYALKLESSGINTPAPIAYILDKSMGLLSYSYFISIQVPYTRRFYEFGNAEMNTENETILKGFARFTAELHEKNIYHQDYSPGNILFDLKENEPEFCVVDINRMEFGPVSMAKGCANFARLWGSPDMFRLIAREYASVRGFDTTATCREILDARRKYWQRAIRRRPAEFKLEF